MLFVLRACVILDYCVTPNTFLCNRFDATLVVVIAIIHDDIRTV